MYLEPARQLWVDAWIPRDDPLWVLDVSVAAEWVGAWWTDTLARLGLRGFDTHTGRSVPGELGELVCFAGRGPGEVFHGGRKLVGLSQWRSREGALFSSCAYLRWDPDPLLELLAVDEQRPGRARSRPEPLAVGLRELEPPVEDLGRVRDELLGSFAVLGVPPRRGGDAAERRVAAFSAPPLASSHHSSSPPALSLLGGSRTVRSGCIARARVEAGGGEAVAFGLPGVHGGC